MATCTDGTTSTAAINKLEKLEKEKQQDGRFSFGMKIWMLSLCIF